MKRRLKRVFKNNYKELIRYLNHKDSILIKLFYRIFWTPKKGSVSEILDRYSKYNKSITFIQIGANDGMEHDPLLKFIRKDGWKGVLIEPQPGVFKKLQYLHENTQGVNLINAALSDKHGNRPLYIISFSEARWATGISSFIKSTLEEQIQNGYVESCATAEGVKLPDSKEDYISEFEVECVNFKTVAEKYDLDNIDLIQIDTEGFDGEIIKMIDWSYLNPAIISFEISHLSGVESELIYSLLKFKGYSIFQKGRDSIAYKEPLAKVLGV